MRVRRRAALAEADGWTPDEVRSFEEGGPPRRLWRVIQTR